MRWWKKSVAACLAFAAMAGCSAGDREAEPESEGATPALVGAAPQDGVSVDVWLEQLEVGSRELFSAREAVADAVGLTPGARVADVGAGTGLYTLLFADRVGPSGVVYAVDIEPKFLTLINQRAADSGFDNVVSVLGRDDSITLPDNSVDVMFIADTYHYFEDRQSIMKSVLAALKPGGVIYVVDYDIVEGKSRPAEQQHVRFGKPAVISEIEFFGFEFTGEVTPPGLEENFMIRFVRP